MTDAQIQQLLIFGAIALGGFVFGLLAGILRGQGVSEKLRQQFQQDNESLQLELATTNREVTALEVEREQLRYRLQEKGEQLQRLQDEAEQQNRRYQDLRSEHVRLHTQQEEREEQHLDQLKLLKEARDNLKQEFELLANRIFEDKGKHFTATSKDSLEALLKPFREQISGFQSRINEVHTESVKGHSALEAEIKKVLEVGLEMNTQATNLTTALKGDKKTTGNWGEAQLERTLELAGLLPGDHYDAQSSYTDAEGKRRLPDFIIKLPDNKCLVIDSKVSLVDYERAISAETEEQRADALKAHALAVRHHIDDLSSKDYSNLSGLDSPDFVLMFMPVEPAYIEAMKYNRDLFNYGYQRQVVMVSHTTLMPILRTVANLWMIDQSNREAREISTRAGEIYNQVCLVAERLQKLGNTLKSANNHYNQTVKGLAGQQGLHGKVERFRQLSSKASKNLGELEPIHADIELERLEAIELAQSAPAEEEAAADKVKLEVINNEDSAS
ncbi:DNA recombination protein RmuC [Pseudohalioglobus sediminis]|uniref:DNA recombination protein RmuC n=1 Tax=Pseudohalioglobus sediminis TaxID=2606449 RepID=A0A5B0WXJ6_9GAMM|nr:DNA recombination protein RmuC [Pseudohalioglobus sediminis]KAA1190559.1 DNA recombination protein RmuC [Pseudohalioglobus sediminis]